MQVANNLETGAEKRSTTTAQQATRQHQANLWDQRNRWVGLIRTKPMDLVAVLKKAKVTAWSTAMTEF